MFEVNGQMVNHAGQPVDEQGKVLVAEQPAQPDASEVDGLKRQVSELTGEIQRQAEIIQYGSADNKRLIEAAGSSNENSFRLKGELDQLRTELANAKGAAETNAAEGARYLALSQELTQERDKLGAELEQAHARIAELTTPAPPTGAEQAATSVKPGKK